MVNPKDIRDILAKFLTDDPVPAEVLREFKNDSKSFRKTIFFIAQEISKHHLAKDIAHILNNKDNFGKEPSENVDAVARMIYTKIGDVSLPDKFLFADEHDFILKGCTVFVKKFLMLKEEGKL